MTSANSKTASTQPSPSVFGPCLVAVTAVKAPAGKVPAMEKVRRHAPRRALNDCGNQQHSCAGKATVSGDPESGCSLRPPPPAPPPPLVPGATKIVGGKPQDGELNSPPIKDQPKPVDTSTNESPRGWASALRSVHYSHHPQGTPPVPWFEALSTNYLGGGLTGLHHLTLIRQDLFQSPCMGLDFRLVQQMPLNWDSICMVESPWHPHRTGVCVRPIWPGFRGGGPLFPTIWLRCPTTSLCWNYVADRIQQVPGVSGKAES